MPLLENVKCIICGRESEKPVCGVCTKSIIMDYPFILRKSFALGDYEYDEERIKENRIIFNSDVERLNDMAKKADMGEKVDYLLLARASLYFHRKFSFYLKNFDIDEYYYLNLGEKFLSHVKSEEGKYLKYQILRERGKSEEAIKVMDELVKESRKREYLIEYGKALIQGGYWGRAVEIYNEIIGENREDIEAWKMLAQALYHGEKYEEAEKAYLKVLEMDQNDYESWYYRGLCLKKLGKWGGALQSFQTAVRKNPKFREGYEEMLQILYARGMYVRAMDVLNRMKKMGFEVGEKMKELEGRM